MTGLIARNDPSLTIVPNWAEFVAWVKDAGYDESYLDVNDSKCLQLQQDYLAEQKEQSTELEAPRMTLDELQEAAGNGKLKGILDGFGIPPAPSSVGLPAKRPLGEGPSFDRETFDQAAYDKRLTDGST